MDISLIKAEECNELVDFLNSVFGRGQATMPHFDQMYPDIFKPTAEKMAPHAVIRDEKSGKILSCVGAYLMNMKVAGCTVPIIGIGQVSTAEEALGKGCMSTLLKHQLNAYKEKGAVLAWLGGRHDRYGHFGFETAGLTFQYGFDVRSTSFYKPVNKVECVKFENIREIFNEDFMALRNAEEYVIEDTLEGVLERLDRCKPDLWVVYDECGKPKAWAFITDSWKIVLECVGDFVGCCDIIAESIKTYKRFKIVLPYTRKALNEFSRAHCDWMGPCCESLVVLNREKLFECYKPFIRPGTRLPSKELSDAEFVRACFGPEPNSLFLPFFLPSHYHV